MRGVSAGNHAFEPPAERSPTDLYRIDSGSAAASGEKAPVKGRSYVKVPSAAGIPSRAGRKYGDAHFRAD